MRTSWATLFPHRVYAPNVENVSALIDMVMPKDVKQVRALMGGINYYLVQKAPSDQLVSPQGS